MCGIIGAFSGDKKTTRGAIERAYSKQSGRGSDGFGFVSIDGATFRAHKRTQRYHQAVEKMRSHGGTVIMFHHRLPTSTPNIPDSNHPIKVSHDTFKCDYYVVHNGVISNDTQRRTEHLAQGHTYTTEVHKGYKVKSGWYEECIEWNDSEALAIDLARFIEHGEQVQTRGSVAYMMVSVNKKTGKVRVYMGRNHGNPLHVARGDGLVVVSSENTTGKGENIEPLVMYEYDTRGRVVASRECDILSYASTYPGSYYNRGYQDKWDNADIYGKSKKKEHRGKHGTTYSGYMDTLGTSANGEQSQAEQSAASLGEEIDKLESELDNVEEMLELARMCIADNPHDTLAADELREYSEQRDIIQDKLAELYTSEWYAPSKP